MKHVPVFGCRPSLVSRFILNVEFRKTEPKDASLTTNPFPGQLCSRLNSFNKQKVMQSVMLQKAGSVKMLILQLSVTQIFDQILINLWPLFRYQISKFILNITLNDNLIRSRDTRPTSKFRSKPFSSILNINIKG